MDNIIVFGDIMLDNYINCNTIKINSETPNIVFKKTNNEYNLGGAGNVAKNLSILKFNVFLLSDLSSDNTGILENLLDKYNIRYKFSINTNKRLTVKKRYICQQNQVFRIDDEDDTLISEGDELKILNNLNELIKINNRIKYLIISDYNKGLITDNLCSKIIEVCNTNKIKVFTDPKLKNFLKYRNSFLIKPNRNEFEKICDYFNIKIDINNLTNEQKNLNLIKNKLNVKYLVITLDKDGILLYSDNKLKYINKNKIIKNVIDVTGAGDTVLCTIVYYFNLTSNMITSVKNADIIGNFSVSQNGCYELNINLLNRLINNQKLLNINDINILDRNQKIIFTNGCFDILHPGHIKFLQESKDLGDILIVGLNSDKSIKENKGESRPINNQQDRYLMLNSLDFVDFIIIFEEKTPYNLIKKLKPNTLVKGSDYKIEEISGNDLVDEVVLLDIKKGYSTTNVIKKIFSSKE